MANSNIELTKVVNATINNQRTVTGTINNQRSVTGSLSIPTEVINYVFDYETMDNLPTINGVEIRGESAELVMTPSDELSNLEISEILR